LIYNTAVECQKLSTTLNLDKNCLKYHNICPRFCEFSQNVHKSCHHSGSSERSSAGASEAETTPATPPSIVHRDVSRWVEPVGGGRRYDDERRGVDRVAIVGTGDFGRALARKLVQAGYKVTFGSRNPDRNRYRT
jgi:hypothetical protein